MVSQLPRPVLAAAVGLPLLLAVAVAVLALTVAGEPEVTDGASAPLALASVPAPAAGSPECAELLDAVPDRLPSGTSTLDRRTLAEPAPPGAAAWGAEQTVVLRCGLDAPAELTRTAQLLDVDGVRWLRLPGEGLSTWVAVDRPVYVALTLQDASGTGPLQDVSSAIIDTLPEQPVRPVG